MTVMPEHAARLLETSSLLVLDPMSGPQPKSVANLALGDEILVQADGRMCFRRLLSLAEAIPPNDVTRLHPSALGSDIPRKSVAVDSRQPVGPPLAQAKLEPAANFPFGLSHDQDEHWMDVLIEGAIRIVVDNLSIGTGPLPAIEVDKLSAPKGSGIVPKTPKASTRQQSAGRPVEAVPPSTNTVEAVQPLKAFTGQVELPLVTPVEVGSRMVLQFTLPPRTTTLRLISASAQPTGEVRKLGVAILRISVEDSDISLESPALVRGFHRAETGEGLVWRWTDGEALLIMQPKPIPQILSVHITDWHKFLPVG